MPLSTFKTVHRCSIRYTKRNKGVSINFRSNSVCLVDEGPVLEEIVTSEAFSSIAGVSVMACCNFTFSHLSD